jgi:hypothetical protein
MSGAIPPLSQYAFMAWCLVKAQGQLYLFYLFQWEYTVFIINDQFRYFSAVCYKENPSEGSVLLVT